MSFHSQTNPGTAGFKSGGICGLYALLKLWFDLGHLPLLTMLRLLYTVQHFQCINTT